MPRSRPAYVMSCRPVSRSNSLSPSGSTPSRRLAATGSDHTSRPRTNACPASGRSRPVTIERVVVLPAPLGPTRPKNDPRGTSRSTPLTATRSPNRLPSPRMAMAGPSIGPPCGAGRSAMSFTALPELGRQKCSRRVSEGRGLGVAQRDVREPLDAGELLDVAGVHPVPDVAEQGVVDRDEDLRGDASDEGDGVAARGPGRVERMGEDVDLPGLAVVGVTGVEERGLAVGPQDDADVRDARHGRVVERVQLADRGHGDVTDREVLTLARGDRGQTFLAQLLGRQWVGVDGRGRVGAHQRADPLRIEVVGVVVGHEYRIETAEVLEARGEVARVDEDAAVGGLDEQAGMSEVSHAHANT